MCANCLTNVDVIAGTVVAGATAARTSVLRAVGALGFTTRSAAERDAHVVQFLRDLDLEPAEILGVETVRSAARLPAQTSTRRLITSHIRSATA